MSLTFNTILAGAGLDPADVRLLRHQDTRSDPGRSPYHLWRNDRAAFDHYQSAQQPGKHPVLGNGDPVWASFVVPPTGGTLFAGLWQSRFLGRNEEDRPWPHAAGHDPAGTVDTYALEPMEALADLAGRLIIDWGAGTRTWAQYAARQDKTVLELHRDFQEPVFPGYLLFDEPLSAIPDLPVPWLTALAAARGIYILTCPATREQYVGSATGEDGFLGRWRHYIANAHGGNVGLRSRNPEDYRVGILEVVGNAATLEDIIALESRWKDKLRTREMGLNHN